MQELPEQLRPFATHLQRMPLQHPPCVYFLMKEGRVVYVGQTVELRRRIKSHRVEKDFDDVYFMPVPRKNLGAVEADLITSLRPPLNVLRPHGRGRHLQKLLGEPVPKPKRDFSCVRFVSIPEPLPWSCFGSHCEDICDVPECSACALLEQGEICNCDACELRDVDPDLHDRVYVLGTEKLPPYVPPTDEEFEQLRAAVNRISMSDFASEANRT